MWFIGLDLNTQIYRK